MTLQFLFKPKRQQVLEVPLLICGALLVVSSVTTVDANEAESSGGTNPSIKDIITSTKQHPVATTPPVAVWTSTLSHDDAYLNTIDDRFRKPVTNPDRNTIPQMVGPPDPLSHAQSDRLLKHLGDNSSAGQTQENTTEHAIQQNKSTDESDSAPTTVISSLHVSSNQHYTSMSTGAIHDRDHPTSPHFPSSPEIDITPTITPPTTKSETPNFQTEELMNQTEFLNDQSGIARLLRDPRDPSRTHQFAEDVLANDTFTSLNMTLSKEKDAVKVTWSFASNASKITGFVVCYRISAREDYDSSKLGLQVRSFTLHNLHKDEDYDICVHVMVNKTVIKEKCATWSETSNKVYVGIAAGTIFLVPCAIALIWLVIKDRRVHNRYKDMFPKETSSEVLIPVVTAQDCAERGHNGKKTEAAQPDKHQHRHRSISETQQPLNVASLPMTDIEVKNGTPIKTLP